MVTIEMIQLASYATSVTVCAAVCAYFLREYLNKRSRASLWWAAGFSLVACAILFMTGGALYRLHTIYVILAFAVVAASVAFLYYAASLHFLDRKSFFREKFTVILFVVSFVLFVLPIYFLSGEHIAEIVKSPAMALFVVAFLVIAVLFAVLSNQVTKVAVRLPTKYFCSRVEVLQSLALIVTVWSLYIALFYGSVIAVGFIFVLSLFAFMLLLYGCKRGVKMEEYFETYKGLSMEKILGIRNKVRLDANKAQAKLDEAMLKIGNILLAVTIEEEKSGDDPKKDAVVTHTNTIGIKGGILNEYVFEFADNILGLAESAYIPLQHNQIPMSAKCAQMGAHLTVFFGMNSYLATNIENLANLASTCSSTDSDMVIGCCKVVKSVCDLEKKAVMEVKWDKSLAKEHPGGVIGHTYNILRTYDDLTGKTCASAFKTLFQNFANTYSDNAATLRTDATTLEGQQTSGEQADKGDTASAVTYLQNAIGLFQNASNLMKDASGFVGNLLPPWP